MSFLSAKTKELEVNNETVTSNIKVQDRRLNDHKGPGGVVDLGPLLANGWGEREGAGSARFLDH